MAFQLPHHFPGRPGRSILSAFVGACVSAAVCVPGWAAGPAKPAAQQRPASVSTAFLREGLAKTPEAGRFVKEFDGPGGLTGVVIELPDKQKMLGFVTPDGRYLISGAVFDLTNNTNLTAVYAREQIGPTAIPDVEASGKTAYALGEMHSIVFGNVNAENKIAVVFDPTTRAGKELLLATMDAAAKTVNTAMSQAMQVQFYPIGPDAAKLLMGSNVQRLKNMLAYVKGERLAEPDNNAKTFAARNDEVAKRLEVRPPLMLVMLPGMKMARAVHVEGNGDISANLNALMTLGQGAVR